MNSIDWLIVAVAFLATLVLTPLLRNYCHRRGLIDHPGPRRSHLHPVARGGGAAIAAAMLTCVLLIQPATVVRAALAAGVAGFALIGWIDDHRPLPVLARLLPELVLAAVLLGIIWPAEWGGAAWAIAVVLVVWWVNLFNFMDGSDGLAASQACFMALMLGLGLIASGVGADGEGAWATPALALAASSAAFLAWNWPPARIFLGDSGSLMLGWSLVFLGLVGWIEHALTAGFCLILAAPFLVDASLTLGLRVARGEQWYTAHRDHAYQILIRSGWSHRRVLGGLMAIDLFLVAPAAGLALAFPEWDAALAGLVLMILSGVWCGVQFSLAGGRVTE